MTLRFSIITAIAVVLVCAFLFGRRDSERNDVNVIRPAGKGSESVVDGALPSGLSATTDPDGTLEKDSSGESRIVRMIHKLMEEWETTTHEGDRRQKLSLLCSLLAGQPEIALDWLGSLPDHPSSMLPYERFATSFVIRPGNSVDAARRMLDELPIDQRGGAFLAGVCKGIAYENPEAALQLLAEKGSSYPEIVRKEAFMNVIVAAASTKSWQEMSKILEGMPGSSDDAFRVKLGTQLIQSQMSAGKTDIAAWVETQADGKQAPVLFRALVSEWVTRDSIAASNWVANQQPGPARDSAVNQMVDMITSDSPEDAFTWAASITDPALRSEKLQFIINRYRLQNPAAAAEMVNSEKGLTDGERESFLHR